MLLIMNKKEINSLAEVKKMAVSENAAEGDDMGERQRGQERGRARSEMKLA